MALKPSDFPPEVHASLSELQQIAAQAKSKDDPRLRYATPMEIALSELLRHPSHCIGHSKRTGLQCRAQAVTGHQVCMQHGARYTLAKKKAEERLQALQGPVLREMRKLAMLPTDGKTGAKTAMTKFKAAQDLLDRAGLGAVVEAKVRHSFGGRMASGVTVQIGFLTAPEQPALEAAHDENVIEATVTEGGETADRPATAADPAVTRRPDTP